MKSIFLQYKPFFQFLLKFLLFYTIFTVVYNWFLGQYDTSKFELDCITQNVANATAGLLNFFGFTTALIPSNFDASALVLFNNDKYVCRIIEGCNAISVIILFAAFVFAFSKSILRSLVFIVIGSILIYLLNIIRVALLSYALYYYPEYEELLHDIVFPLFIYGVVFVLWILWITKFSGYEKKVATE